MANVIKHKRGSGSDPAANNLVLGELAIRTDTGKLFTKMDSGAIAEIAGGGSDIALNTLSSSSATGGGSATFNGSAYRFTLSAPPSVSAQQLLVSINGVIQKPVAGTGQPSEGFSVDGTDIILGDAPATGSDFFILTFKSLGVSEPADNSVTSAKIVDGAIVNADINASAAIQGTKISPNFGSQNIITTGEIKITNAQPGMVFEDTGANPDFIIQNRDGSFAIRDTTNAANRFLVNMANGAITGTGDMTIDTDTLHVDSSNDRVGIGTTSPATTLAVKSSGANTNQITLVDHDSTNEVFRVGQQSDGDGFLQLVQDEGTVGVSFDASGNSYFNGGNLGIGTSTIGEKLTIGDGDLKFFNSDEANNHRTTFIEFQNSSNRITSESNFGSDGSSAYAAGYKFSTKNYTGSAFETLTPFVIQANGNVGINNTTPAAALYVNDSSSDNPAIFDTGNGNGAHIRFKQIGSTKHYLGCGGGISMGNANQLSMRSTDNIHFATGNSSTIRASFLNGGGLSFNGDTAAANALDDYEEGTFTPSFANVDNSVITVDHYNYTKVGRLVHINAKFTIGSNNDGSRFGFQLPFNQAGSRENVLSAISDRSGNQKAPFDFVINANQSYAY